MPHRLSKVRVLLADPTPVMADITASALRGIGVRSIARAHDSTDAERRLASARFDAVVVSFDLRPKPIGEFVVALRRSRLGNAHVPVIAIAQATSQARLKDALLAGVDQIVRAPVSGELLRSRLLSAVTDRRQSGEVHEI